MERSFVIPPSEEAWKKAIEGRINEKSKAILERLHQEPGKGVSVKELQKIDPDFTPERAQAINFSLRVGGAKCQLVPMCDVADWETQDIGLSAV